MKRLVRSFVLLAVLTGSFGLFALPAHAAPTAQEPIVYQLPCNGFVCDNSDQKVPDGGAVTGKVQIKVRATASIGQLEWVEVQAKGGSANTWFCLRRFNTNSPSLEQFFNWDTTSIPSDPAGCVTDPSGPWGDATGNDAYDLRVRAADASGTSVSGARGVNLSNRPDRPHWAGSPRPIGNRTKSVRVELRWLSSPDRDIVEYAVVRIGPDGEKRFHYNAASPGGQGCSPNTSTTYTCYDDDFPREGYEGTYRYSLLAYRKTKASTGQAFVSGCRTTAGNCIESPLSDEKNASLTNPPEPSPEDTPDPTPTTAPPASSPNGPSASPSATKTEAQRRREAQRARVLAAQRARDYIDFFTGEYNEQLPFDQRGGIPFPSGQIYGGLQSPDQAIRRGFVPTPRDTAPYKAAAGGMLMLLSAAHMGRLLRREPGD